MKVEILTVLPEIFDGFLGTGIIKRAQDKNQLHVHLVNIRNFAAPPHFHVDDAPYGGGAGMVMKPEPLAEAIEDSKKRLPHARVILLSPGGQPFTQIKAKELSETDELILICGRYEGIDERIVELFVDEEISIGDYVLMGGEVPAMVLIESSARFVPGVLGNTQSIEEDSFAVGRDIERALEGPQYTRPPEFRGRPVPEVLLSGNHDKIRTWREEVSLERTKRRRPDLIRASEKD